MIRRAIIDIASLANLNDAGASYFSLYYSVDAVARFDVATPPGSLILQWDATIFNPLYVRVGVPGGVTSYTGTYSIIVNGIKTTLNLTDIITLDVSKTDFIELTDFNILKNGLAVPDGIIYFDGVSGKGAGTLIDAYITEEKLTPGLVVSEFKVNHYDSDYYRVALSLGYTGYVQLIISTNSTGILSYSLFPCNAAGTIITGVNLLGKMSLIFAPVKDSVSRSIPMIGGVTFQFTMYDASQIPRQYDDKIKYSQKWIRAACILPCPNGRFAVPIKSTISPFATVGTVQCDYYVAQTRALNNQSVIANNPIQISYDTARFKITFNQPFNYASGPSDAVLMAGRLFDTVVGGYVSPGPGQYSRSITMPPFWLDFRLLP